MGIDRAIFVIIMNDLRSIIKNYGILEAYLEQVAEFTA